MLVVKTKAGTDLCLPFVFPMGFQRVLSNHKRKVVIDPAQTPCLAPATIPGNGRIRCQGVITSAGWDCRLQARQPYGQNDCNEAAHLETLR